MANPGGVGGTLFDTALLASPEVFGGGGARVPLYEEGNIYRGVGNPLGANAADTTDDILGGWQLPAGCLDVSGRGLMISAQGITGATANNKRFKIFLNPTMVGATINPITGVISGGHVTAGTPAMDSGVWVNGTTPNSGVGWNGVLDVFKYGAAGSNTQYSQGSPILGVLHGGVNVPQFLTLAENAAINIVVTGASYTTGAANDLILQLLEINAMN